MASTTLNKDEILEAISNMTVLELSELLKAFEERFGVTAAAPVAVAGAAGPAASAAEAPAEEEQDEFDVILTGAGDKKIQVINCRTEVAAGLAGGVVSRPVAGRALFAGAKPAI
jgi:large subunit ribosomal protein L7/L12